MLKGGNVRWVSIKVTNYHPGTSRIRLKLSKDGSKHRVSAASRGCIGVTVGPAINVNNSEGDGVRKKLSNNLKPAIAFHATEACSGGLKDNSFSLPFHDGAHSPSMSQLRISARQNGLMLIPPNPSMHTPQTLTSNRSFLQETNVKVLLKDIGQVGVKGGNIVGEKLNALLVTRRRPWVGREASGSKPIMYAHVHPNASTVLTMMSTVCMLGLCKLGEKSELELRLQQPYKSKGTKMNGQWQWTKILNGVSNVGQRSAIVNAMEACHAFRTTYSCVAERND